MKLVKFSMVLLILLLLPACFVKKEDYDKETVAKVEETVKNYLHNNYEDIQTIEIEKIYKGQLGGLNVDGTVNNKYMFNLDVEESDFSIGSIARGKGFPKEKDECKEKDCPY